MSEKKLTLKLSVAEWEMIMEALTDHYLRQCKDPRSGANPFALYDFMADELGDYKRGLKQ